jgi:pimeloyl-ACP methyl ester carboxylesterase
MNHALTRRSFVTSLAANAALTSVAVLEPVPASTAAGNVVLIHGLYTDGSCWSDVADRLRNAGMSITSVQNPLRSFGDDVATARHALAMQNGPTVLVAHSYGGIVATEVGVASNVSALVYVAARAPEAGEDFIALAKKFPTPPGSTGTVIAGDLQQLSQNAFLNDFASGVDPFKARELYEVQAANAVSLPATARTTVAAWRSKPSFYAVSTQDRMMNPDLERFLAKRMNATTIEVHAGHLSLISHPEEIANLILRAAGHAMP